MTLAPEDRLLLVCARTDRDPQRDQEITELLETDLNWDYLLYDMRHHTTSGLLYYHLQRFPQVSPAILEELKARYQENRERAQMLYADLSKVLARFEAAKIPAILLKGGALTLTVYPDPGLRWFHDIDLLIRPEDLSKVRHVLDDFTPVVPLYPSDWHAQWAQDQPEQKLIQGNLQIDLHWVVVNAEFCERAWSRTRTIDLGSVQVRTFSPTDMLIHLGAHMHHHLLYTGTNRLSWYSDIAELIRLYPEEIDWYQAVRTFRQARIGLAAAILSFANRGLGAPVPNAAVRSLWSPAISLPPVEKLYQITVKAMPNAANHPIQKRGDIYNLPQVHGLKNRLRYLWGYLFPNVTFMEGRYRIRRPWIYLWYPVRLLKGLGAGLEVLAQLYQFPIRRSTTMQAYQEIVHLARRGSRI